MTVKILNNNFTQRMNTIKDLGEIDCPTFAAVPLHWEHGGKMLTSQTDKNGVSLNRGIINEETGQLLACVKPSYQLHQFSDTFESLESLLVQSDLDLNGISREVGFSHGGGRMKVVYNLPAHEIYGLPILCLSAIGLTVYSWRKVVDSRNHLEAAPTKKMPHDHAS